MLANVRNDLTPITYFPVTLQKQFSRNQEAIAGKEYANFFTEDLTVPASMAKGLRRGPMPPSQRLTPSIADINKVLDPSGFDDFGYACVDGSMAFAQSRHEMPDVTTEMFKWWFLWHPLDKARYSLWFPHAHVDNYVEDPKRLADTSLSYEKRLYNNPNHINEYIGPSALPIIIHFNDPVELGLDRDTLKRNGFTASASGTIRLGFAPDTTYMLMLHLARDTERGLELVTRYWIGTHPEFARFPGGTNGAALVAKMGLNEESFETTAYEMAVHDMTEFNQLKRMLPELYKRFGR
jgi:2,4-diacetylphloroglucinol hydrolase